MRLYGFLVIVNGWVFLLDKYLGKYRVASARAPFWDYGWAGTYFIMPCALNHACIFGEIVLGNAGKAFLRPSHRGEIVLAEWEKSFPLRPELLGHNFTPMLNHLHALLQIVKEPAGELISQNILSAGAAYRVPKSASSLMGGFKAAVSGIINTECGTPGATIWQPRFHNQIIRDNHHFDNAYNCIETNPQNWLKDHFYH